MPKEPAKPSDNFRKAMRQILFVPKAELKRREGAYKALKRKSESILVGIANMPPKIEYEFATVFDPPVELDEYIKKVFKLSTSPTDALSDDDWSFVVKMSAYVEVVLNELLMAHFNEPRLEKIIEKMNMGSDRQGKLAFTKALELLPAHAWQFMKLLSDLRGEIVHRISMLNLDLSQYLNASPKKEAWKLALGSLWDESKGSDPGRMALVYPRWFIFRAVMGIMSRTAVQTDRVKLDHDLSDWMRRLGEIQIYRRRKEKPRESNPNPPAKSQSKDRSGSL